MERNYALISRTEAKIPPFPPIFSSHHRFPSSSMEAFSLHVNLAAARPSAAASSLFNQHRTLFSIFSTTFLLLRSFLTVASHTQTLQIHTQTPMITQQRSTFSFFFFIRNHHGDNELFQQTRKTLHPIVSSTHNGNTLASSNGAHNGTMEAKVQFFRCVLVFLTWAMDFSFCNHSALNSLLSHSPGRHGHSRESADALLRE